MTEPVSHVRTFALACRLAAAAGRAEAAARLAAHLGAEALIIFVRNAAGGLVPAPGFAQALPDGPGWEAFLKGCENPGVSRVKLAYPDAHTMVPALGYVGEDGILFALLGGDPEVCDSDELGLPLLGALLTAEQRALASVDGARVDLERALHENRVSLAKARENEARKVAVVRACPDAIISMDQQGRILEFNPAAEELFGYTRAEALGRDLADTVIPPTLREAHRQGLAHHRVTGEGPVFGKRVELNGMRRDGSEFPVELAIQQIDIDGPPTFTSFLRDITKRKQAEQQRERLLGVVGHDLRNPLNSIIMGVALLLASGDLPEPQLKVARRVQSSARRMTRMIADLLDFERSREGAIPIVRKQGRLLEVVTQAIDELAVHHPPGTVRLHAPAECAGAWDADRLTQVVSNLVGNAIQHSPAGSPVTVGLAERGDTIILEVSNQNLAGPIPPEDLPRIFNAFRRGKHSSGLGLGLYIVQLIARAHGGAVTVQSVPQSTTFRVELPRTIANLA